MCADVAVCCGASCWVPATLSKCGGELHRWSILLRGHEGGREGGRKGGKEGGRGMCDCGGYGERVVALQDWRGVAGVSHHVTVLS